MSRGIFHQTRVLRAPSSLALSTAREGAATASLGNLGQGLTTLMVKNNIEKGVNSGVTQLADHFELLRAAKANREELEKFDDWPIKWQMKSNVGAHLLKIKNNKKCWLRLVTKGLYASHRCSGMRAV